MSTEFEMYLVSTKDVTYFSSLGIAPNDPRGLMAGDATCLNIRNVNLYTPVWLG